jgi:hypothetical protein
MVPFIVSPSLIEILIPGLEIAENCGKNLRISSWPKLWVSSIWARGGGAERTRLLVSSTLTNIPYTLQHTLPKSWENFLFNLETVVSA